MPQMPNQCVAAVDEMTLKAIGDAPVVVLHKDSHAAGTLFALALMPSTTGPCPIPSPLFHHVPVVDGNR